MTELWFGFAILLVLALAFLFMPMFISFRRGELVREQANIEIYKDQLADLKNEYEAGKLNSEDYESLTNEVKRNLLADTEQVSQESSQQGGGRWVMGLGAAMAVVVSIAIYNQLGAENELIITDMLKRSTVDEQWSLKDSQALLERLQQKVDAEPEDVETWYMIGRINFELNRFDEAVLGFNRAIQHLPESATQDRAVAIAQMAQAQFFANDRKLDKATESLLNEAVKLNPNDTTTLGLLGVAAFESGQYMKAITYWRQLLALLPAEGPNAQPIKNGIAKAIASLDKDEREALLADIQKEMKARQEGAASITVTVDVSDEIRSHVPSDADLFVLAKAESGPPMPLAVQRIKVNEWPVQVELNDSMAMMPQLKLSAFENVVITARISKSGEGRATAGDIEGKSSVLSVNEKQANVEIAYIVE